MPSVIAYDTDVLSEKLIDVVIRKAVGFRIRNLKIRASSAAFEQTISNAVEISSKRLVRVVGNQLYCNVCGRGPFTRKGMYLHLLRTHKYDVKTMVRDELRELENFVVGD